ncbi:MAG: hypothetical protein AB8B95_15300 [Pseudohongiellaceae bacterium]
MNYKPVILLYDLNNALIDECAMLIGQTGLYTTINTYNESNAIEALRQYNRGFGFLTNRLSCVVTGWNSHKKRRDQFLFRMRDEEKRSPIRAATPVIMITEDHRFDLKQLALDPTEGSVAAYMDIENFQETITDTLHKVVFGNRAQEMNSIAYAQLSREEDSQ